MAAAAVFIPVILLVLSLPYWLPRRVTACRNWLFARINGPEGTMLPGPGIGPDEAMRIYRHPNASGRAEGAELSDLFWYWMAPGPQYHQENMEAGAAYDVTRRTTRKLLAIKPSLMFELAHKYVQRDLIDLAPPQGASAVHLTTWFMPMFAAFYYEVLFGREASADEIAPLVAHAANFLSALKGNEPRAMRVRSKATAVIKNAVAMTPKTRFEPLNGVYTEDEVSLYLQGNFFSTGVVQMSEAMAHALLALAEHGEAQSRLATDPAPEAYVQSVLKEVFRLYPLFGISHRILQDEIALDDGRILPKGTVICLDHEAYNQAAYAEPDRFMPERWYEKELAKIAIPFGTKENRSCPAEGFVVNLAGYLLPLLAANFSFDSAADHQRSLANFAPCYVRRRGTSDRWLSVKLLCQKRRDEWSRVSLSLRQLVFGAWMITDARRVRLCEAFFRGKAHPDRGPLDNRRLLALRREVVGP